MRLKLVPDETHIDFFRYAPRKDVREEIDETAAGAAPATP